MTVKTQLTCLCGAIKVPGTILASARLPCWEEPCHCNSCRWSSGAVMPTFVSLKGRPDVVAISQRKDPSSSALAVYATSKLNRYFCRKCGTHCFLESRGDNDDWYASAGIVEYISADEGPKPDIVRIRNHMWVSDTVDGGVAGLLTKFPTHTAACYPEDILPTTEPMNTPPPRPLSGATLPAPADLKDKLPVRCHCGGVDFYITRPAPSPAPDSEYGADSWRWWLTPPTYSHYRAKFCVCRSCRLATGFALQAWAYVPRRNLIMPDGTPFRFPKLKSSSSSPPTNRSSSSSAEDSDPGNLPPTLQLFNSSPGVSRHFCSTCGATVFWYQEARKEDTRPDDIIDVSIGLLRAEEGVRAERWLSWTFEDVSQEEETLDREVMDALLGKGGVGVDKDEKKEA